MIFLPICVNVENSRILMIGGGNVALHKLKALLQYTRDITLVATEVKDEIKQLGLRVLEQPYSPDVLGNYLLVYACTNNRELNRRICDDAHARGLLVNVADDPKICDFVSPAIYKQGHMSVAVSSNGEDIRASLRWREAIRAMFEAGAQQVARQEQVERK